MILEKLGLEESIPKRNNFLVDIIMEVGVIMRKKYKRPAFRRLKEQKRRRMLRDVGRLEFEEQMGKEQEELPYPRKFSFKLLGIVIDCHWACEEHIRDIRKRAAQRLAALNRVAHITVGLESRVRLITTHSLIESLINYGLAVYGAHCGKEQGGRIDSMILNKAARKIIGTSIAVRREVMHIMADTRSFGNHHSLKTANIVDRAYRAEGTNAQKNVIRLNNEEQNFQKYSTVNEKMYRWKELVTSKENVEEIRINTEGGIIYITPENIQWDVKVFANIRKTSEIGMEAHIHLPRDQTM